MRRPTIEPGLVAALTQQAPARLVKKLDATPRAAEAWRWSEAEGVVRVVTDSGETVTLRTAQGAVREPADVACTCLLAPRCFHLLAVVTLLDPSGASPPAGAADDAAPEPATDPAAATPLASAAAAVTLEPEQVRAAAQAWRAGAELLDAGALGAGPTLQAELLRSVHSCRATGLVRLANAGVRVVLALRDLRADRPEFSLAALARDVTDLLETAWTLTGDAPAPASRVGVARRRYAPVGSLRVHGLFTEPVIAGSGYAGVVTHLVDATGRLWSVSAVEPGAPPRAVATYEAAVGLGDATLPHRALGREGLFVQDGTGSPDGRLGSGKGVRAVRAGPSSWDDEPAAALWRAPLEAQWSRARAALELPPSDRTAGADLVFLRARVLGRGGGGLVVAARDGAAERVLCCLTGALVPGAHDDLAVLACAPGLELRCVVRPLDDRNDAAALLAFGPAAPDDGADEAADPEQAGRPRLHLPAAWAGRANLGLDRLARSFVEGGAPTPVALTLPPPPSDPLDALERRLQRVVLGGRGAAAAGALAEVEREARLLERRLLPTAATLHRALAAATVEAARTFEGTRARGDPDVLGRAWTACAAFARRARSS